MRPRNVPGDPAKVYKHDGWQGWGHWLGNGSLKTKQFLPFDGALTVAQSLKLANKVDWRAMCKNGLRPPNVPSTPDRTYKHDGWQGWGHWLGTDNVPGSLANEMILPFDEAARRTRDLDQPRVGKGVLVF